MFQYLFGYAWLRFYMEESIKKSFIKTDDEFIFDIETAALLPVFQMDKGDPHKNPYVPILVSNHSLNPKLNVNSVNIDYDSKSTSHKICNLEQFRTRFNIFCTNKSDKNLFNNINFSKNKMAITGSIMTACLQYRHPLLNLFNNQSKIDYLYQRFFNEYYAESDIDIMILTDDVFDLPDGMKIIIK